MKQELIDENIKAVEEGKHWETLVNFNLKELIIHLEKQFKKGMTWKNYGKYWHIDHRIPVSHFNFKSYDDEDFKKCWALDNLQPLKVMDNFKKGNRYSEPTLNQIPLV